jgi:phage terminase large subunit
MLDDNGVEYDPDSAIDLPLGWTPRWYQFDAWEYLNTTEVGARCCLICHRRWGKDDLSLHWAARAAFRRRGNYWHMLPQADQGRKAIWDAVDETTGLKRIDIAFPIEVRRRTLSNEMKIEFRNGSTWQVVGSDNYNSLIGSSPVGIVFSEWAVADPQAWGYLRPILARNGGWAIFITTPRGKNHAHKTYLTAMSDHIKDGGTWYGLRSSVYDTDVFNEVTLNKERRELENEYGSDHGAAQFDQEYDCSFDAAMPGAFYTEKLRTMQAEGRVCPILIDRAVRVHTAWDLGRTDSTAIWFVQCVGRERRLVDYYEASGMPLEHYVEVCNQKKLQYKWQWGEHFFPHDLKHKELTSKLSRIETLTELGFRPFVVPIHFVMDGINAVRRMLDRTLIDPVRCERGLEALKAYKRKWNEENKDWSQDADHSWASHGADALRSFAAGYDEPEGLVKRGDRHREGAFGERYNSKPTHWSA